MRSVTRAAPTTRFLDDYEPDELTANLRGVLADLREQLVPLVAAIGASSRRPNVEILKRTYPVAAQESFGIGAAKAIGFDFDAGRLDVTAHPFCTTLGPRDCRITTHYYEQFFSAAFFGIMHEAGHGIYEQGLPPANYGLPIGEAISLGVHESQSRMWENLVGRSRSFWRHFFPAAQQAFPQALGDVSLDDFYFAVNDVRPSLIRIEADEATYNLHILVRFELEQSLLDGTLNVADLPGHGTRSIKNTWASRRPPTPTACCRTCIGARAWSAISRPTRWGTSTPHSISSRRGRIWATSTRCSPAASFSRSASGSARKSTATASVTAPPS